MMECKRKSLALLKHNPMQTYSVYEFGVNPL
jgi:hypothetical protein